MRQRRHASLVLGQTRSTEPLVLLIPWHGETDELIPRNRLVLETPLRCYEKYEPSWNKFKLPRRAHQQLLPVINRWIIKVPILLPFAADYFHSFAALQGSSRPRRLVGTKTSQNFAARGHKTTDLAICLQPPAEKKTKTKKTTGFSASAKTGAPLELSLLFSVVRAEPTPGWMVGHRGWGISGPHVTSQRADFQTHALIALPVWESCMGEKTELASISYEPRPWLLL